MFRLFLLAASNTIRFESFVADLALAVIKTVLAVTHSTFNITATIVIEFKAILTSQTSNLIFHVNLAVVLWNIRNSCAKAVWHINTGFQNTCIPIPVFNNIMTNTQIEL